MNLKLGIAAIAILTLSGTFISLNNAEQVSSPPGEKEIAVAVSPVSEYSFDRGRIRLGKGDAVKVTFTNTGKIGHNWAVPIFNAATPVIGPGEEATVSFTAGKSGRFEYLCTVPGHRERGMFDVLDVA